jgi:hypothetical protein
MLQAEMSQDGVQGAFDASFPANHSVEAAKVPTPPTQDDLVIRISHLERLS